MARYGDASRSRKQKGRFFEWDNVLRKMRGVLGCARRTKSDIHGYGSPSGRDMKNSHGLLWVRGRLLGTGSFGSVFLAKNRAPDLHSNLPSEIAVKSSLMADSSSLQFEKKVLRDLALCVNIVHCYGDEITETESGEKVYNILLEYCSGCSLHERIIRSRPFGLTEWEVRRYTRDIVRGLAFTHCSGYIHGDLKPNNILLLPSSRPTESGSFMAKLADFGLAKRMCDKVSVSNVRGAFRYLSPELLRDKQLDWPADIWALGCVVVEMLTGQPVWHFGNNKPDLLILIAYSEALPGIPSDLSEMAKDFLGKCLVRSPYERSTSWTLMNHPFVRL